MAFKHSIRFLFIEKKTLLRTAYVSVEDLLQDNVSSQRTGYLGSCPLSDLSLCHVCLSAQEPRTRKNHSPYSRMDFAR